jgi:hypothetical protein
VPRPSRAMKGWGREHVWNWLRGWCVPCSVAYDLFLAGVDGKAFISLYIDACRGVCTWPFCVEALNPIMRAGRSAQDQDFLMSRDVWVSDH